MLSIIRSFVFFIVCFRIIFSEDLHQSQYTQDHLQLVPLQHVHHILDLQLQDHLLLLQQDHLHLPQLISQHQHHQAVSSENVKYSYTYTQVIALPTQRSYLNISLRVLNLQPQHNIVQFKI